MRKILTFALKQLQFVYSDKGLLLFMLVTPVVLATIIGLAFGSGGGTLSIEGIPIAIVNLDDGTDDTNFGETIQSIILSEESIQTGDNRTCPLLDGNTTDDAPDDLPTLDQLFDAVALSDPDIARAGVDTGEYDAVIIIPADFSAKLEPDIDFASLPNSPEEIVIESATLEIYASGGAPIGGLVTRSVAESIVNDIVTGSTTINATLVTLLGDPLNLPALTTAEDSAFEVFGCAFNPELHTLQLERLPLDDVQAESSFVQIMVAMGSAQAVFFAIFTMNNALLGIYNDKRTWILQRLLMTPTPRIYIIAGKILGATFLVLLQVSLLLLAMTVVASIVTGEMLFIWGDNILLLLILTLVVGLSVAGLGVFVIGLGRTPEQANIFGTLTALGMGMLGGAFGFNIDSLEQFSIIYWGVNGYSKLSGGNTDIGMNLLVLLLVGAVLFVTGSWLFNRRIEV